MFGWLLPKEVSFFKFFSQHAALTALAAEELVAGNHAKIEALENHADDITHQCVEALRKTFITPLDRHDIFRLIYRMDDIMDSIDAAVRYSSLYKVEPSPEYRQLADLLARCIHELEKAINGLQNLKNSAAIIQSCIAVNQFENESDQLVAQMMEKLFEQEQDWRIVLKKKEIYGFLETAFDRCEDVANIIEGIILEYS